MRHLTLTALVVATYLALVSSSLLAQTPFSTDIQESWLAKVLPGAQRFSELAGEPPVYRGYRVNETSDQEELVGLVFHNADFPPMRVGYAAPINMLVGLNMDMTLSGIMILDYTESYLYSRGDFIDSSVFLNQFKRKSIEDQFRLNRDVDGLSSATSTSAAIIRTVVDTSRRVASAYLGYDQASDAERSTAINTQDQLSQLSWQDMIDQGIITQMHTTNAEGAPLTLSFTYIGRSALGDYFIGADNYISVQSDATFRSGDAELLLIAPSGLGAGRGYRPFPMSMSQDGETRRVAGTRFVNAGEAIEGAILGNADYGVAIAVHPDIDITRPFNIIYHVPGSDESVSVQFALNGVGLALARNEAILSDEQILEAMLTDASFFQRLKLAPPWGETPWLDVGLLLILLTLVMTAFLLKSAKVRWTALTMTLFYLGFYKAGFLSVSHITSLLKQGPEVFFNNLPTLIIVVFTLVTTLLWGRIFCSSLCPFGALQDVIAKFTPSHWRIKVPQKMHDNALYIKYGILALIMVTALTNPTISIFQYFEPFGTIFFLSPSIVLWAILAAILVACVLVERFYCRYVCPLGAALAVISFVSPFRIKRVEQCTLCKVCEHACPTGAIRGAEIDFKECVRCDDCETKLIKLVGTCRHPMEEINKRKNAKKNPDTPTMVPVNNLV